MAKNWYPVIDYMSCMECGTCVNMCPHGVYNKLKAPSPVVVNPENCIDHCHGCGNRCPAGAITYVGDNTGWTPPKGKKKETESCCSCGTVKNSEKTVLVEYLYLDLETCTRCIGTDTVLEEVLNTVTPALKLAGYEVRFNKIKIDNIELAKKYHFLSSPTIRVNGYDICGPVKENNCGCCGEISGSSVDCRVFEYQGSVYEVPPKEMLSRSIFKTVFGNISGGDSGVYELPENLKAFFDGKKQRSSCLCTSGKCC